MSAGRRRGLRQRRPPRHPAARPEPRMTDASAPAHRAYLEGTVDRAVGLLAATTDRGLRLKMEQSFRDAHYRAAVLRCRVLDGGPAIPQTVIVKRFRGDRAEAYDPDDVDPVG